MLKTLGIFFGNQTKVLVEMASWCQRQLKMNVLKMAQFSGKAVEKFIKELARLELVLIQLKTSRH